MRRLCCLLLLIVLRGIAFPQNGPDPDQPPDFAITRAFLENLHLTQKTFLPTYKIKMHDRSDIKDPSQDCEVHLAGFLQETFAFGEPSAVIVEPPNVCKFKPNAANPSTTTTKPVWRTRLDTKVLNKDCDVTGFARVYTEHDWRRYRRVKSESRLRDTPGYTDCLRRVRTVVIYAEL